MTLAIFDLDKTLLAGDSDHAWGEFLVEQGIVDAELYRRENDRFYQEYLSGQLDIEDYLSFALAPLAAHDMAQLQQWREQFLAEKIRPMMQTKATDLIDQHRNQGHTLMIITATNRFITEPVAGLLGIEHLIATDPELQDGRYTGRVAGTPSFRDGKVSRLNSWLDEHSANLEGAWFYSDSHNDLPLLRQVANPVAVDPDPELQRTAQQQGWPILSLRD
ncbi:MULTISPECIES: HAD family hydrolase [Marinobacter]|uniref:histidinol-phosphatase n=1 Tax=Marinobacter TaxID=2742 RepID=UPI001D078C88|nr:HAD family hydrolase [Marinobacter sp. CA1]MCG8516952.1 HAD-IB family hydrolase [Pseudomonadales bacterium]MCK7568284.1 HAD-IB family hydrolase [Marinobacter xestospongiae]UDL04424.1 HAD family hydrolase [Marinobacter sp. CA1]